MKISLSKSHALRMLVIFIHLGMTNSIRQPPRLPSDAQPPPPRPRQNIWSRRQSKTRPKPQSESTTLSTLTTTVETSQLSSTKSSTPSMVKKKTLSPDRLTFQATTPPLVNPGLIRIHQKQGRTGTRSQIDQNALQRKRQGFNPIRMSPDMYKSSGSLDNLERGLQRSTKTGNRLKSVSQSVSTTTLSTKRSSTTIATRPLTTRSVAMTTTISTTQHVTNSTTVSQLETVLHTSPSPLLESTSRNTEKPHVTPKPELLTLIGRDEKEAVQSAFSFQNMDVVNGSQSNNTIGNDQCKLNVLTKGLPEEIAELLQFKVKLIEYDLHFENYSENPLKTGEASKWRYKQDIWTRVSTVHGQSLLTLAFNYGVLSLTTLRFGIMKIPVWLQDEPAGCFGKLPNDSQLDQVVRLLLRDFSLGTRLTMDMEERVCYQVIEPITHPLQNTFLLRNEYVTFTYKCCTVNPDRQSYRCQTIKKIIWLKVLDMVLMGIKFFAFLFGPVLVCSKMQALAMDNMTYVVKMQKPIKKTICAVRKPSKRVLARHVIDLRNQTGFHKVKDQLPDVPENTVVPINISQFEIKVDYSRLLGENTVPVGLKRSFMKAFFQCYIKDIGPFKTCCQSNMFRLWRTRLRVKWIQFFKIIGLLLTIAAIPIPYYFRILMFYKFEHPELLNRELAAESVGLHDIHDYNILHYLSPGHPLYLAIYTNYLATILLMGYFILTGDGHLFKRIIVFSFSDLYHLSWLKALDKAIAIFIWPFEQFGIAGCLIAVMYWPIVIPLVILIYSIYCLPLIYLTARIVSQSIIAFYPSRRYKRSQRHGWRYWCQFYGRKIEKHLILKEFASKRQDEGSEESFTPPPLSEVSNKRIFLRILGVIMIILDVWGLTFIFTECVGFLSQICAFTLMGIIVNASAVLKYVTLVIMVVLYSRDCYDSVYKKYLMLNKGLFAEVKGCIRNQLQEVMSLPEDLQENSGLKKQGGQME